MKKDFVVTVVDCLLLSVPDSAQQRRVTKETLFQVGSISKPIATLRAHQLMEERRLDLDVNVNDYLTSWELPDNELTIKEKVTTRRMLTPRTRTFKPQSPEALARFVGDYQFPENGDGHILVKEDGLNFSADLFSSESVFLLPETDTIF